MSLTTATNDLNDHQQRERHAATSDHDDRLGDNSKASPPLAHQRYDKEDDLDPSPPTTTSPFTDFPTSPSSTTLDSHSSPQGHTRYAPFRDQYGSDRGISIEIEQEPLSPSSATDTIERYYQQRAYREPLGRHQIDSRYVASQGDFSSFSDGLESSRPLTATNSLIESPSTAQTDGYPLTPRSANDNEDNHSIASSDYPASNRLTTLLFDLKMEDLDAGYGHEHWDYRQQSGRQPAQRNPADDQMRYSHASSTGTDASNPATTPTSASHELFHTAAIKMHSKDIEAMHRAAQSGIAANPLGSNPSGLQGSAPAQNLRPAASKDNLRAPLSLSNSQSGEQRRGRDVSPPRKSPLHQVTGFDEAQREWQGRTASGRDPATGFPLPPTTSSSYTQSNGQSLASFRSQGGPHGRYDHGLDDDKLGSPHGSSPVSPFNPKSGLTSFSPRAASGLPARQMGMGGRAPIGASAYDRVNTSDSSQLLQSPDSSNLGGLHSYSQPEIHDMARAHGNTQDDAIERDPRGPYGAEALSQQGARPTLNGQGKPVLHRAWSDGAEHFGVDRRTDDARTRLQGFREEDERYDVQNTDSRARRVESDRGDMRGRAGSRATDLERPFAVVSSIHSMNSAWDRRALTYCHVQQSTEQAADYVIAVIGQASVGKTMIIRKAFRSWGLVELTTREDEDSRSKVQHYTANVETGQPPRMRVVQILEIDLRLLQVVPREARGQVTHNWPEGVPRIDGVMVCYDAMSNTSAAGLAEAIRKLFSWSRLSYLVAV